MECQLYRIDWADEHETYTDIMQDFEEARQFANEHDGKLFLMDIVETGRTLIYTGVVE